MNKIREEMRDHPLTKAAREVNQLADDGKNVEQVCELLGLDAEDVMYVAEQRALRSVFLFSRGINLKLTEQTQLSLSSQEAIMLIQHQASYMDGLCIGWKARDYSEEKQVMKGNKKT